MWVATPSCRGKFLIPGTRKPYRTYGGAEVYDSPCNMRAHTYVHIYIYVYVYIYVYIRIHLYINVCMFTLLPLESPPERGKRPSQNPQRARILHTYYGEVYGIYSSFEVKPNRAQQHISVGYCPTSLTLEADAKAKYNARTVAIQKDCSRAGP